MSNNLIILIGLTCINLGLSIWAFRGRRSMIRRNKEAKAELQKIHQDLLDTITKWEDEIANSKTQLPLPPPNIRHHPN